MVKRTLASAWKLLAGYSMLFKAVLDDTRKDVSEHKRRTKE